MTMPMISFDSEEMVVAASAVEYEAAIANIGTKSDPMIDHDLGAKFHVDGIGAEIAPLTPFRSPHHMLDYMRYARDRLQQYLQAPTYGANFADLNDWPDISEASTPILHHSIHEFGCSPDYLRGKRRIVPGAVTNSLVRELGMHFHLNLPERYCLNPSLCGGFAHEMAQASGPYHLQHLGEAPDGYRPWYRVPGVYRPTQYGIEYRSFGSGLLETPDLLMVVTQLFWDMMVEAINSDGKEVFL